MLQLQLQMILLNLLTWANMSSTRRFEARQGTCAKQAVNRKNPLTSKASEVVNASLIIQLEGTAQPLRPPLVPLSLVRLHQYATDVNSYAGAVAPSTHAYVKLVFCIMLLGRACRI